MVQVHIMLKIVSSFVTFYMPELQVTLVRQCQDYGISEEYSPKNPTLMISQ